MSISLLVASPDEHFRETVRESLINVAGVQVVSEYLEVSSNLYIRVLQDLERHPSAALIVDLAAEPEEALKALEKIRQAVPDLYLIGSSYHADGETVIACVRSGCCDFLSQPIKRLEFREAMGRLERSPRKAVATGSRLGRVYTFLGAKGGVGATTLAVNFAGVLAQRKQHTVLVDLDFTANDCLMMTGGATQHSLLDIGQNLSRLDPALFEGLAVHDPLGFHLIGPPDQAEQRAAFTEPVFREFASFLVEKYEAVVIDAGRWIVDDIVLAALQCSSTIFLVISQQFPAIRNAQRYISSLMRMGFQQDQIKLVVNSYQKKPAPTFATLEQIRHTLSQPVFYGIPASPAVPAAVDRGRPIVADRSVAPELDKAFRAFVDKATGARDAAAAQAGTK